MFIADVYKYSLANIGFTYVELWARMNNYIYVRWQDSVTYPLYAGKLC